MDMKDRRRMMLATEQNRFWIFKAGEGLKNGSLIYGTSDAQKITSAAATGQRITIGNTGSSGFDITKYKKLVFIPNISIRNIGYSVGLSTSNKPTSSSSINPKITVTFSDNGTECSVDISSVLPHLLMYICGFGTSSAYKFTLTDIWLE